jgi:hypothetical protein
MHLAGKADAFDCGEVMPRPAPAGFQLMHGTSRRALAQRNWPPENKAIFARFGINNGSAGISQQNFQRTGAESTPRYSMSALLSVQRGYCSKLFRDTPVGRWALQRLRRSLA